MKELVNKLYETKNLNNEELIKLLYCEDTEPLKKAADKRRREYYGTDVYFRGLIEFTNYCKNDCYYCGIRASNKNLFRYRLSKKEILECCKEGYSLGFRTFVLQGGEDLQYDDDLICSIVSDIKNLYPDCAITLSIGEKSYQSYKKYFDAGADRYLLRHETANDCHYQKLHPNHMSLENRKKCLWNLKEIGYQVGAGFMVGAPYETSEDIIENLRFLQELRPDMIGIGPFLPHKDTPFGEFEKGSFKICLRLISIIRLMLPYALIPATTALGTINPKGREMGLQAGANVVMPNLSPVRVRKHYELYDNKICTGEESAQCIQCLGNRVKSAGYSMKIDRGDVFGK